MVVVVVLLLLDNLKNTDPAHFNVELYNGFHGYGFVEVVENGLRSIVEHCCLNRDNNNAEKFSVHSVLHYLLPLTVFWRKNCVKASDELNDNYERVDVLLDVLAKIWKAIYHLPEFPPVLNEELSTFAHGCTNEINVFAEWWVESFFVRVLVIFLKGFLGRSGCY